MANTDWTRAARSRSPAARPPGRPRPIDPAWNSRAPSSCGRSRRRCWLWRCCCSGLIGYQLLPVLAALPEVDFPTIQVVTGYPGASPEVIETAITAPLEHYFGQIAGLTSMSSTSSTAPARLPCNSACHGASTRRRRTCRRRSTRPPTGFRPRNCPRRRLTGKSTPPIRRC